MAAKTETVEDSLLQKAEKELSEFIAEKTSAETSLKSELEKAKSEYEILVKDIQAKYNIAELEEKIKRHTYFTKLLKGEVAFPEDLEASRRKGKSTAKVTADKTGSRVSDWSGKISSALTKIGKTVADNPQPKQVRNALIELYPELSFEAGTFNAAWGKYKKDNK